MPKDIHEEKKKSISSLKVTCLQVSQRILEDDINSWSCIILIVFLAPVDHHGEKDRHLGELVIHCETKLRNFKEKFL